ncbi:hypothetical protein SAMN05421869_132119 [Nonomuraea jiangxiensis]|uniref:Uncharacterized protein n=1 Tax=Nonomuraea jiangxiensis TaxID=633440 RepID=A0A1G9NW13_9ACTN|nr:hypothetical protein SAMN05421869_132119 [Nonomuraea jiangxiensis]
MVSSNVKQKTGKGHSLRTASGSPNPRGRANLAQAGSAMAPAVTVKDTNAKPSPAARSSMIS